MPRPDPREPKFGQEALFAAAEATAEKRVGQVTRGRHSEAMDRSIIAAHSRGLIEDVDEGAATLLRAVGTNADEAERVHDLWALSKLLPGAVELLDRLQMTPAARITDETDAAIVELVDKMQAASAEVDEDDDAPVHHPEV